MSLHDQQAFERFVSRRRSFFSGVSRRTNGEYRPEDVQQEAWTMAAYIECKKGIPADFDCPEFSRTLRACLYNHIVKFKESKIRNGVRLDHNPDAESEDACHWLMDRLAAEDGWEPEFIALRSEEEERIDRLISREHSTATAYLQMIRHFNYEMAAVADYLLVTTQTVRRHYENAVQMAKYQRSFTWPEPHRLPFPRPWRRDNRSP